MKKSIISAVLISTMVLTGCGSNDDTNDMTNPDDMITNENDEAITNEGDDVVTEEGFTGEKIGEVVSDSGDKTIATVTFENGTPTYVDLDVETASGMKSQLSEAGDIDMGNDGMMWHEQTAAVENAIIENEFDLTRITLSDDGKTDVISGVTISVNDYLEAVQDALNQVD